MRKNELNNIKDYKYGFSTDIENIRAPKGLNTEIIKFPSGLGSSVFIDQFLGCGKNSLVI